MAENENKENNQPEVPPKLVIKPQDKPAQNDDIPRTVKIRKPVVISPPPTSTEPSGDEPAAPSDQPSEPEVASGTQEAAKKQTSRIPLDSALASGSDAVKPGTIKIKPVSSPLNVSPQKPTVVSSPASSGEEAADDEQPDMTAEKRKTSRISLEAALASESADADSAGPKTIRLKRPSEAATVKVGQSSPPKTQTLPIEPEPASLNKTADISGEADVPEPTVATRKKTIRVKRPSRSPGVKAASGIKRAEAEVSEEAVPAELEEAAAVVDRPNWFFIFAAVVTVIVSGVLIYVLTAQAFGPNASLTRLSYGAPEVNLAWPGKIQPTR